MTKLKMHLTKSCPTLKERQRINQLLKTTKGQNALKAGLEQAIAKECQAMVSRGQAGWANDPAINYAVLVQKNTGVRILSVDLAPIQRFPRVSHPPVSFPWTTFLPLLPTADFERFIPHMYLDSKGNVTIGIGHLITGDKDAVKIHNGHLPFFRKNLTGRATDAEVVAEFNRLTALKSTKKNFRATAFSKYTHLKVDQTDAEAQARFDAVVRIGEISAMPFTKFASYPAGVQMAIDDLVFTMGAPGFRSGFPKFQNAVLHRDWLTAKAQSSRTGVLAARNTAVAAMFDAAIAAEKFFITTNPQSRNNRLMFTTEVKLKLITVRTPGP